jgi:MoxR-like ATPase
MAVNEALSVEEFQQTASAVVREVGRVIVGQDEVVRYVLICVIAGGHALLEGVPGLGKTTLIRTLSEVLHLKFSRIQFTPDLMPADITGTNVIEETVEGRRIKFQAGPVFANLLLADEINRATPKTQSALLEAMQEKTVTIGNQTYRLEPPFFVMATQNPLEMAGTYPLPEAQLDRFMLKVNITFPTATELVGILNRTTTSDGERPSQQADGARIVAMGDLARKVPVASHVTEYVAKLIRASHPDDPGAPDVVKQYVEYGSSPRGAQSLILAAKIHALLSGRFNVSFEDIRALAPAALRHRIILKRGAKQNNVTPDTVINDLLTKHKS